VAYKKKGPLHNLLAMNAYTKELFQAVATYVMEYMDHLDPLSREYRELDAVYTGLSRVLLFKESAVVAPAVVKFVCPQVVASQVEEEEEATAAPLKKKRRRGTAEERREAKKQKVQQELEGFVVKHSVTRSGLLPLFLSGEDTEVVLQMLRDSQSGGGPEGPEGASRVLKVLKVLQQLNVSGGAASNLDSSRRFFLGKVEELRSALEDMQEEQENKDTVQALCDKLQNKAEHLSVIE